jgi:hypothetical protein
MKCREFEDQILGALYGELDEDSRARLEAHLVSCPDCARLYESMKSTLGVMEMRERPDPGEAFWDGYFNRLSARMEREHPAADSRGWLGRLFPGLKEGTLRWAYRGVLAVLLIAFGAVIGRMLIPGPGTGPGRTEREQSGGPGARGVVAQATVEDCARQYIEDSQVLLLALVNLDPKTEGQYLFDWSAEKVRSRELAAQGASLKSELDDPEHRRLRDLVGELELIMIQIANLGSTGDLEAVDLIRSSVNDQDVMLRINLEKLRGGDRPQPREGECDA